MESEKIIKRYRSVYKYLRIGAKEYAVLDAESAQERALDHFEQALRLLQGLVNSEIQDEVNKELVLATDFGSKDAPFLLALRILDLAVETPYLPEEIIVFLKLAAERGHADAAYRMGCCYAGMTKFPDINVAGEQYFTNFDALDRSRLAIYYLMKAVMAGHQQASEDLIIAYAYGRGFIQKNANAFIDLCEQLANQGNQAIMVGYGAWLMGLTVEGTDPLPEAIVIDTNYSKALDYLLLASKQNNLQLAQHALYLICVGIRRGFWGKSVEKLRRQLVKSAYQENPLLALYLGWYSIPLIERQTKPHIFNKYQLTELSTLVDINEDYAISLLGVAFFGADEDVAKVAKEILSLVFGKCFLNDEGLLIWDKKAINDMVKEELFLFDVDAI